MEQNSEITRLYRGFKRRVNKGKPLDSYPFLSGDSYFYSCEFYFESGNIVRVPSLPGRLQKPSSLFVRVSRVADFLAFLSLHHGVDYSNYDLVLHNGDNAVSLESLKEFNSRFRKVFSVNLLSANESSKALPIGLENRNLFTNGVPADFKSLIASGLRTSKERSNLVLQSFSLQTNIGEREACGAVAAMIGSSTLNQVSPAKYRRALASSKFVLSPAGNGFDCHRTWEAMYLGAIPIVKRVHWPFADMALPVLIVNEWQELREMNLNDLQIKQDSSWSEDFWNSFYNE